MFAETADLHVEAARLRDIVANEFDRLIAHNSPASQRIDGVDFRLFQRSRNAIYRATSRYRWFVKLLGAGDPFAIPRERLGAATIAETIGSLPSFGGSPVTIVSENPPFVLSTEVDGVSLDRALVRAALLPIRLGRETERLTDAFRTVGHLLAVLHTQAKLPSDAPEAEKREFKSLAKSLRRIVRGDAVTQAIGAWYERNGQDDDGRFFVHGNMRPDNLLHVGDRIAFLDFEHCGSGQFYQDLARPIAYLVQLSTVSPFAQRSVSQCVQAYLGAYRKIHAYDPEPLNAFINARLARHYLQTRDKTLFKRRIAGIPITREKLARLMLTSLHNGLEGVIPSVVT